MGLYPPTNSSSSYSSNSRINLRILPTTFKIRDAEKIHNKLGDDNPLPMGFVQIPIFSHIDMSNIRDDLDFEGCDYVNTVDGYRFPHGSTYVDYQWLMDDLRAPISDWYNLTYEQEMSMTAMELYNYCDVL